MLRRIFRKPVGLHELSFYILTRGLFLAFTMLLSSLVFLAAGGGVWLSLWYAKYLQTMAAVLFGAALLGSLLVEDILKRC